MAKDQAPPPFADLGEWKRMRVEWDRIEVFGKLQTFVACPFCPGIIEQTPGALAGTCPHYEMMEGDGSAVFFLGKPST